MPQRTSMQDLNDGSSPFPRLRASETSALRVVEQGSLEDWGVVVAVLIVTYQVCSPRSSMHAVLMPA